MTALSDAHDDTIVFVADDDLWRVDTSGGPARRVTAGLSGNRYRPSRARAALGIPGAHGTARTGS